MGAKRLKAYIAVVEDESGATYAYPIHVGRHRDPNEEAREVAARQGVTLLETRPAIEWRARTRRRQGIVVVIGITIAVTALVVARGIDGGVL